MVRVRWVAIARAKMMAATSKVTNTMTKGTRGKVVKEEEKGEEEEELVKEGIGL